MALLAPATHATTLPPGTVRGDLSGRMRAARPMSRGEIERRWSVVPTPLPAEGARAGRGDDDGLERVPRHLGARVMFGSAVALAGLALAAGLTYGTTYGTTLRRAPPPAAPPPPRAVVITFGSDPSGALVVGPSGALGATPLSVQMPPSQRPVTFRFEKPGFEPKEMESIPNVPSSIFAIMKAEETPAARGALVDLDDPPPPERRVAAASRHRQAKSPVRHHDEALDTDGVLAPSFEAQSPGN